MINVRVRGRSLSAEPLSPVTAGSVGLPVVWDFSPEWEELAKTAVFRGSGETRDVAVFEDRCTVPAEVLTQEDGPLEIGVCGRLADGTVVMPTVWGRIELIYAGAEPSEVSPADPTPDWTAQVQAAAAAALAKANAVEEAAAGGAYDGRSYVILGYYATLAALRAAVTDPAPGDSYAVGSAWPYNIYVWDAVSGNWKNNGPVRGKQGEPGPKGDTGSTGPQGERGPGVNRNLLDNWYFVGGGSASGETFPINQRGQSAYSLASGAYGIDRWKSGDNAVSLTVAADGVVVSTGSNLGTIQQVVGLAPAILAGKKVTYSILHEGGLVTGTAEMPASVSQSQRIINLSSQIPNGRNCDLYWYNSSTIIGIACRLGLEANASLKVKAVKLEIGDTQTLAHQEDGVWVLNELPDPTAELAKCKRYYQRITQAGASIGYAVANVMAYTTTAANLTLRLGMIPAASNGVSVTYSFSDVGGVSTSDLVFATARISDGIPATSVSGAHCTDSGDVVMNVNATGALTVGAVYNLALTANGAWLAFSTEP